MTYYICVPIYYYICVYYICVPTYYIRVPRLLILLYMQRKKQELDQLYILLYLWT